MPIRRSTRRRPGDGSGSSRSARARVVGVVAAVAVALAAVAVLWDRSGDDRDGASGPRPSESETPGAPETTAEPVPLEPPRPVSGLMTRQGPPGRRFDFIESAVVHVKWADLEVTDGQFTGPGWGTIESARLDPRGLALKLRIMAGADAPDFVKRLGGPPRSDPERGVDCEASGGIAVVNGAQPQNRGCVPYFWTDAVLDQYEDLMREVARRYDQEPPTAAGGQVSSVVASACMTIFAEPFFRAHGDVASNERLRAAGLDATTDRACQRRALAIHERHFERLSVALAVNGWDVLVPTGGPEDVRGGEPADGRVVDWPAVLQFVTNWRTRLGDRLELQNNGLGPRDVCAPDALATASVYCGLRADSGRHGFQTETWRSLGGTIDDLLRTLDLAISYGACFVELPAIPSEISAADIQALAERDATIEAGCGRTPTRARTRTQGNAVVA